MKTKAIPFSTLLAANIKKILDVFCKQRGIKIRYFIEQAIIEKLEDEMDIEAYELRKNEEEISLEDLLKEIH